MKKCIENEFIYDKVCEKTDKLYILKHRTKMDEIERVFHGIESNTTSD